MDGRIYLRGMEVQKVFLALVNECVKPDNPDVRSK